MDTSPDLPQDAIISVLAHLHPRPVSTNLHSPILNTTDYLADHPDSDDDAAIPHADLQEQRLDDDIARWSGSKLRAEVVRLRGMLRAMGQDVTPPDNRKKRKREGETGEMPDHHGDTGYASSQGLVGLSGLGGLGGLGAKEKERKRVVRDQETGKRVDKGRRLELGKAIRAKMRFSMGIGEKDRLPPPSYFSAETTDQLPELAGYGVPNWLSPMDESSVMWVERMATEIIEEAANGQHPDIPPPDLDADIVKASSRTAFMNFCRKYIAETDPGRADKKVRHQKGRRRWARKDLKQKKRAKAASDPSFNLVIPATALHLDYMSSEYSSAGEETDIDPDEPTSAHDLAEKESRKAARAQRWREAIAVKVESMPEGDRQNYGAFGFAQGDKVLEVRKPRWRSDELSEIYSRLDNIAVYHSLNRSGENVQGVVMAKKGHIAPTNSRFTMDAGLKRRGKTPRETGEGWMWRSGRVGVWPRVEGAGEGGEVGEGGDGLEGDMTGMAGMGLSRGGAVGVSDVNMADGVDGSGGLNALNGMNGTEVDETTGWQEGDDTGALVHALEGMTES